MGDVEALAPMFLAHAAVSVAPAELRRFEMILRALDSAGRTAWPDVVLSSDVFVAHLAEHVRAAPDLFEALASIHAADLFLACACAREAPGAFAAFDRAFLAPVPMIVSHIDGSAEFAEDIAQEIREQFLLPRRDSRTRIGEYSGRGSLASYLRVVALRIALRLRRERRGSAAPASTDVAGPDPELDYLKMRYRGAYEKAFHEALQTLSDRDKLLLRLQYVDGMNLDRIGDVYRVHRSTVARWRADVRRRVLEGTRMRLHAMVGLSDSEIDSLCRVVRSEMRISLRRVLEVAQAE